MSLVAYALANIAWLIVGAGFGLLGLIFFPWAVARAVGGRWQQKIGDIYLDLAMTSLDGAALVAKERGGLDLVSVGHSPEKDADEIKVDGKTRHVRDDNGVVGRLSKKRFGVVVEALDTYVSPLQADLGRHARKAIDHGDAGRTEENKMRVDWSVPAQGTLLNLLDARSLIPGACSPMWGDLSEDWTRKSQEKFHEKVSLGQVMIFLMAFAVGSVLTWFVVSYGPDTGGSSVTVPIMIGVIPSIIPSQFSDDVTKRTIYSGFTVAACLAVLATTALTLGSVLTMLMIVFGVLTALTPPAIVKLFGPSFPRVLAEIAGNIWFTLAQMSYGTGILVETDEGEFVVRALLEDENGEFVRLEDGTEIGIRGDKGDFYRIGWNPFGVISEKTERNMQRFIPPKHAVAQTDGGDSSSTLTQQGYRIKKPNTRWDKQSWKVWGPAVYQWVRGSAGSELVENGKRQALKEEGGAQQLGTLGTMLGVIFCLMSGAVIALLGTGAVL